MRAGGQAEVDRAKLNGRWDAAYRQRNTPIPDDLRAALVASPTAAAAFDDLSSQNRFAILFRLGNVRLATTRQRKLGEFIDMLEQGRTLHP
jgi:uncharacterized protein YdeI (YjbR/CyaY-like superfamily)